MNQFEIKRIINLYSLFQFECLKEETNYLVFRYNSGYFYNIELLVFPPRTDKVNREKQDYETVGYSVTIKEYNGFEETHSALYRGFFNLDTKRNQFFNSYRQYYALQSNHVKEINSDGVYEYKYINSRYIKDGNTYSDEVYKSVGKELLQDKKRLIILEASAGMGKTSTAYEILNFILQSAQGLTLPLLIELTRNRGARIFRHVLDDEIERNFRPSVNRDLVIEEIKLGNILLIIDGFDELLSRPTDASDSSEDNSPQTMLDTIAELLTGESKARIVLTSRKSSIFVGDKFDLWQDQVLPDVPVSRYQLLPPTIANWLEKERVDLLTEKMIGLESLSNPVLLSILKYIPLSEIYKIHTGKSIIELYLEKLLDRERIRQSLLLDVKEQEQVFVQLAYYFVVFEIMSEDSDFLKDLFLDYILKEKVFDYLNRYTDNDIRPLNVEEFAAKFVHHALLDRVQPRANKIGFINDFVFGFFIAQAIKEGIITEKTKELRNEKYIAFIVDACLIESSENKETMYHFLKPFISCLNDKQSLETELALMDKPLGRRQDVFYDYIFFSNKEFSDCSFENCTFSSCTFQDCLFDSTVFSNCYFINCQFYDCDLINENTPIANASFINCVGEAVFNCISEPDPIKVIDDNKTFKIGILENFWPKGKDRADSKRTIISIFKGTRGKDRKMIMVALTELVKDGFLTLSGGYYILNHKKMDAIRDYLGR